MIRYFAVILFLGMQLFAYVYAKFTPVRYFCWAPFDMHIEYKISAKINGVNLSDDEVRQRYKLDPKGMNPRSYWGIIGVVEQFEDTYGKEDKSVIEVKYKINGNDERIWNYDG